MIQFLIDYMQKDCVGSLSIAHLVHADKASIFSSQCTRIAKQCSIAVDFPKTGVPAEPLSQYDRPKAYPDFMQKYDKLMYKSESLLAHLDKLIRHGLFSTYRI